MKFPKFPVFFPDATRGLIKSLDTSDIESTKTNGILVNTYHLYKDLGMEFIKKKGGIKKFMNWQGFVISDSGGFQVGSLIKMNPTKGHVSNNGVLFKPGGEGQVMLTPEKSIAFQMELGSDMVVVLDDFTDPKATYKEAKESMERTINWARRGKREYEKICKEKHLSKEKRPYILGVVQGGFHQDLRKYCIEELIKIGFDGLGYGGWPINDDKSFDYESAKTIADNSPKDYLLYGLGVGKPDEIVRLFKMGYTIFDCVLPTRDARHGRAYIYDKKTVYKFLDLTKGKMKDDDNPIDPTCDCLTCTRYSRSYINHLFKTGDFTAGRLVTIHNLRFYSNLMEKLRG
ncbi:MAG TPA: tRNA guanosine(34) transglycosylase Tgt [Patescibacteria group bacterium]|nr:tRNA guanosine(34) transglycosylase Tgt [Patescibacteria group bacterium]